MNARPTDLTRQEDVDGRATPGHDGSVVASADGELQKAA
jgi:hypothetical protein